MVVPTKLSRQPQEWLFEIVVGLCGNVVVLQIFLAMKGNLFGLDFTVLDFDLVSYKDNRDILAYTSEVTMPVWYILVRNTGSDIEHDDSALSLNVVSITKTPKLFLASCIPNIEFNWATVGVECERLTNVVFPTPPSPTKMSLNSGALSVACIIVKNEYNNVSMRES